MPEGVWLNLNQRFDAILNEHGAKLLNDRTGSTYKAGDRYEGRLVDLLYPFGSRVLSFQLPFVRGDIYLSPETMARGTAEEPRIDADV